MARQASSVEDVESGFTCGTVLGVRASAGVAGFVARRTKVGGEDFWESFGQIMTVFTSAFGVASSGSVTLTIAVTFSDDAFVEHIAVVNAFCRFTNSVFLEVAVLTFSTLLFTRAAACFAGVIARLAFFVLVIEETVVDITRN